MTTETDIDRAEGQAKAQLEGILELVKALEDGEEVDGQDAREAITDDALSVAVRSDWHTPGESREEAEYTILLCTGGPAVRITGTLATFSEPDSASIEYQDWFTAWQPLYTTVEEDAALLTYAQQFYFGD